MRTKILINLYWITLLIHNYRQREKQGLIPLLLIINSLIIISIAFE